MRILILSDFFPPDSRDGAGIVAYRLAKEFLRAGHDVFVVTTCREGKNEGMSEYGGMKIYKIYSEYDLRFRAYVSLYNFQTVKKLEEIIKKVKPDIIHAHNIHVYLSYKSLGIAKRNCGAVVLTAHDLMLVHYEKFEDFFGKECLSANCELNYRVSINDMFRAAGKRYNPFRNLIIRHYLKAVDKIFSISNEQKKVLEINGIKNIETVYNGIDVKERVADVPKVKIFKDQFGLSGFKVIFFAARMSPAKGSEVIVKALGKIKKEVPTAKLLVVGSLTPSSADMKKLAEETGVGGSLCFTDLLDEELMRVAYASADVCVTPSVYFDSFNLINIEAMAAKKPVVGTCFGGTPEIVVDNETGFIVNPLNIGMLAGKIIKLLDDPALAEKMGQAGYERVLEYFNLGKIARVYLDAFEKTLSRKKLPNPAS